MFDFDHESTFQRRIQNKISYLPEYLDSGYRSGIYYIPRQFRHSKGVYAIFVPRSIQITSDIKRICRNYEYFFIRVKIPKSKDNMWIAWPHSIESVGKRFRDLFSAYFGMTPSEYNNTYDPERKHPMWFGVDSMSGPTKYDRRGRRESRSQPNPSYVKIVIFKEHKDFATIVDQICGAMNWRTHKYRESRSKGSTILVFHISPESTLGEEIIDEVLKYWKGKTIG